MSLLVTLYIASVVVVAPLALLYTVPLAFMLLATCVHTRAPRRPPVLSVTHLVHKTPRSSLLP